MQVTGPVEARHTHYPRFCHARPMAVRWRDRTLVTGAGDGRWQPACRAGPHEVLGAGCSCHPARPVHRCLSLVHFPAAAGCCLCHCCYLAAAMTAIAVMTAMAIAAMMAIGWQAAPAVVPWRAGMLRFGHLLPGPCRPSQTAGCVMPPGAAATEGMAAQQPAVMSLPGCRNPLHISRKMYPT